MKKISLLILSIIVILAASSLSGCTGSAGLASSWPGLLINQNTGYLADNTFIYAVNLENGSLKWKFPADKAGKGMSFYAAPVLTEDGQLIVGGYDHILYSLDANNGTLLWTYPRANETGAKDRYIASPLVTSQGIFAPNADGYLYALDLKGIQLWPPFQTSQALWAQPATDGKCQCLYVSSMDHHLYAIDSASGTQIWKSPELGAALVAVPTFGDDGTIYVGTFGKEMLAIDSTTGNIKWRVNTSDWVWSTVTQKDDTLFFGDLGGTFYALNTSGQEKWNKKADGSIVGTPLVVDQSVYFGTETGAIYASDLNGNPEWGATVDGKIYSPILASGDSLYVTPSESKEDILMVAFTTTGTIKWSFVPPK